MAWMSVAAMIAAVIFFVLLAGFGTPLDPGPWRQSCTEFGFCQDMHKT